jgi:predicted thioredoxin/glutaredoxin
MRLSSPFLMATAAFLVTSAGATNQEQATYSKAINGIDSKRLLRSEALHEWPERLEEYVENHHLIRHILWWCQEEMEPEEVMKEVEPGSEKEEAALIYKHLLAKHHKTGRRLIQCGV